jgi:hypothetical protein
MIPEAEAIRRFEAAISRVDQRLILDRGNVRAMTDPYPGIEFGLHLGEASVLLFMPEADLDASDWESRLFKRFEAARRYLEHFPLSRQAPGRGPRRRMPARQSRV